MIDHRKTTIPAIIIIVFIITLIITFLVFAENVSQSEYETCLENCYVTDDKTLTIDCRKDCTSNIENLIKLEECVKYATRE